MSRMIAPSRARATMVSSVYGGKFGRVSGQGDHSSLPTRGDGIATGGAVSISGDGLTHSSMILHLWSAVVQALGSMCTCVA
jgi:hypothetical protein